MYVNNDIQLQGRSGGGRRDANRKIDSAFKGISNKFDTISDPHLYRRGRRGTELDIPVCRSKYIGTLNLNYVEMRAQNIKSTAHLGVLQAQSMDIIFIHQLIKGGQCSHISRRKVYAHLSGLGMVFIYAISEVK